MGGQLPVDLQPLEVEVSVRERRGVVFEELDESRSELFGVGEELSKVAFTSVPFTVVKDVIACLE